VNEFTLTVAFKDVALKAESTPWSATCVTHRVSRRVTGVILDVDGTLVDSNTAHARAWVDTLTEFGYDLEVSRVQRLIGMGTDKLLPTLIGVEKDSSFGKKLTERRKVIFRDRYLPDLQPTRGARALLDLLEHHRFGVMVASSAEGDELSALLGVCGAPELTRRTPPPDAVGGSKPDPDVVAAALGRLHRSPSEVVMLGDTPYDVEAAQRAGIGTIALRSGGWHTRDLAGALAIYDDPADLVEHFADSPLAKADN
jgi:phosphoglycolate phosphatase-like HAD superfamily hydrolase